MENRIHNCQRQRMLFAALVILLPAILSRLQTCAADDIRIPLRICSKSDSDENGWKTVRFRGKRANQVCADNEGLHIKVQSSVSLLVYCLSEQAKVHNVVMRGAVTGLPEIPQDRAQGDKEADDFAMRLGLVVSGTRKLGPAERLFAPEIVTRLCELAPDSGGVDHVQFLNLANRPPPKWRKRTHPLGKGLLREQIVCTKAGAGDFILRAELEKPLMVFALCIGCDGDDTQSEYALTITEIRLNADEEDTDTRDSPN